MADNDEEKFRAMLDGILGGSELASESVKQESPPLVSVGVINFNAPVVLTCDAASARACLDSWLRGGSAR